MRTSKISRLPHQIREQLNLRLHDNDRPAAILKWLNSLPETKALLAADFQDRPITKQNLSDWRFAGFRDWLLKQQANDFFNSLDDEKSCTAQPAEVALIHPSNNPAVQNSTAKLLQWTLLQYAAIANQIADADDPLAKWARLREFCADIARLRRSDLYAQFLDIQAKCKPTVVGPSSGWMWVHLLPLQSQWPRQNDSSESSNSARHKHKAIGCAVLYCLRRGSRLFIAPIY